MRVAMPVLKMTLVMPAVLMSVLVFLALLVLSPPVLAMSLLAVVTAGLIVVATGIVDRPLAALLTGSRPASAGERAVLAALMDGRGHRVVPDGVLVRRSAAAATPAVRIGRDMLVVTPWLVEAIYRRRITTPEAVAIVLHAEGAHRVGRHRLEIATLVVTGPWRSVIAVCQAIGRVLSWFPLVPAAWALRGVVGAIAVVQSIVEGRPWAGILAGIVVALTYLVPAARRARERAMLAAGDDLVIANGLGPVLGNLLRRSGAPFDLDRHLHLRHSDPTGATDVQPQVPSVST